MWICSFYCFFNGFCVIGWLGGFCFKVIDLIFTQVKAHKGSQARKKSLGGLLIHSAIQNYLNKLCAPELRYSNM